MFCKETHLDLTLCDINETTLNYIEKYKHSYTRVSSLDISKSVNYKNIDLIIKIFNYLPNLKNIDFSWNQLTFNDIQKISNWINNRKNTIISYENNCIDLELISEISKTLPNISSLNLSKCLINDLAFKKLSQNLIYTNQLTELFLSNNKINYSLHDLLDNITNYTQITNFSLSKINNNEENMEILCQFIENNKMINHLDLSSNDFSNIDVKSIINSLIVSKNIKELSLNQLNIVFDDEFDNLSKTNIFKLNLSKNTFSQNSKFFKIIQNNSKISKINLTYSNFYTKNLIHCLLNNEKLSCILIKEYQSYSNYFHLINNLTDFNIKYGFPITQSNYHNFPNIFKKICISILITFNLKLPLETLFLIINKVRNLLLYYLKKLSITAEGIHLDSHYLL